MDEHVVMELSTPRVPVVQPSSAAAERVFSILNRSFNDTQNSAVQELVYIITEVSIETSVMMQFNNREVWVVYVSFTHVYIVVILKGIIRNYW